MGIAPKLVIGLNSNSTNTEHQAPNTQTFQHIYKITFMPASVRLRKYFRSEIIGKHPLPTER